MPGQSAIVVALRLPAALERIRMRETADAVVGVPAHVTLLFPFAPSELVDEELVERVARVVGTVPAFDVEFGEVRRWDPDPGAPEGLLWLRPDPAEPFMRLTGELAAAFPAYPPYAGAIEDPVPHLTLCSNDRTAFEVAQQRATAELPFARRVDAASLLVEGPDGLWTARRRLPLG